MANYGEGGPSTQDLLGFTPIPQLKRPNADTFLIFLSTHGFGFQGEVDDLWYSAHNLWGTPMSSLGTPEASLYLSDEPASTLACTQQVEFCNPNKPKNEACEPMGGYVKSIQHIDSFWNEAQLEALNWTTILMAGGYLTPNALVGFAGSSVLVGRYSTNGNMVGPLPNNQWQLEVEHLVASTLASLQATFVSAAKGTTRKELRQFRFTPETSMAKRTCSNQVCYLLDILSSFY